MIDTLSASFVLGELHSLIISYLRAVKVTFAYAYFGCRQGLDQLEDVSCRKSLACIYVDESLQ